MLQCLLIGKVDDWGIEWLLQVQYALDHIAIARNHRTVEAVEAVLWVIVVLIYHVWHQDAVYLLILIQFLQMAVSQLGREADVVAHHRIERTLVFGEGGLGGEDDVETCLSEQRIPEWVLLVHVENARDANFDSMFWCIKVFPPYLARR